MAKIVLTIEADGPADLQNALRGLANGGNYPPADEPAAPEATEPAAPKASRSRKAADTPAPEPTTAPQATAAATAPAAAVETATTMQESVTAASPASSEPAASSPATSLTGVTMDSVKAALTAAISRVGAARCQEALKGAANGQTSLTTISTNSPELLPEVQAALEALQP